MQEFSKLIKYAVRKEMAKGRPETIFKQVFYDVREKVKDIKKNWEQEAGEKVEKQVLDDLASKNIPIIEHKFSLGKYRGSRFVTSFKLKIQVKDEKSLKNLVEYLRKKYSPKWRVNKFDNGVAELNLRGKDIMNKEKVARELCHIAEILRTAFDSEKAYKDMKKSVDNTYDIFRDYRKEAERDDINDRKVKLLDKMEWNLADVIDDLEKFKRMDD